MALSFGVVTGSGIAGIKITSFSIGTTAEIAEARGADGKVTDLKAYSQGKTASIKGYVDGTVNIQAGNTITIDGGTYIVESATRSETNTGYAEYDISAKTADSATISAYGSGSSGGGVTQ